MEFMNQSRTLDASPVSSRPQIGGDNNAGKIRSSLDSSHPTETPMLRAVLDRHSLIATIESRLADPCCPSAFLLLVVLEDEFGAPVVNGDLVTEVGSHLHAMIRATDLIATLDAGELAMVVFDLPPIQRVAFTDGITMAVNGVLDVVVPGGGVRALVGTSSMRVDAPMTDAFRQADRMLRADKLDLSSTLI